MLHGSRAPRQRASLWTVDGAAAVCSTFSLLASTFSCQPASRGRAAAATSTLSRLYAATHKINAHSRLSTLRNMTTATTFGGTVDGEAVEPAFWVSADSAAPRPRPARGCNE